jgi:uncharacterized membrane protein YkvI
MAGRTANARPAIRGAVQAGLVLTATISLKWEKSTKRLETIQATALPVMQAGTVEMTIDPKERINWQKMETL